MAEGLHYFSSRLYEGQGDSAADKKKPVAVSYVVRRSRLELASDRISGVY